MDRRGVDRRGYEPPSPWVGARSALTTCRYKGHDEIVILNRHAVDQSRGNNYKHNIFPCELIILGLLTQMRMNVTFFQKNISFYANIQFFPLKTFSYDAFQKES